MAKLTQKIEIAETKKEEERPELSATFTPLCYWIL